MREYKIGEEFVWSGISLKCIEDKENKRCRNCEFAKITGMECNDINSPECASSLRTDGKDVVFVKNESDTERKHSNCDNFKTHTVKKVMLFNEDELQLDGDEYDQVFESSVVDGVRMFPCITDNQGNKIFLDLSNIIAFIDQLQANRIPCITEVARKVSEEEPIEWISTENSSRPNDKEHVALWLKNNAWTLGVFIPGSDHAYITSTGFVYRKHITHWARIKPPVDRTDT
jgi:hypothetical protein